MKLFGPPREQQSPRERRTRTVVATLVAGAVIFGGTALVDRAEAAERNTAQLSEPRCSRLHAENCTPRQMYRLYLSGNLGYHRGIVINRISQKLRYAYREWRPNMPQRYEDKWLARFWRQDGRCFPVAGGGGNQWVMPGCSRGIEEQQFINKHVDKFIIGCAGGFVYARIKGVRNMKAAGIAAEVNSCTFGTLWAAAADVLS